MTSTDLAKRDEAETPNPFGAVAKVFAALADFFGNPDVQRAGRKLLADLEIDDDFTPSLSPPVDIAQLGAGRDWTGPDGPFPRQPERKPD